MPVGFLSKALKTNQSNIRGWGRNKYQRKTWYCFDLQSKKLKYDAPKMQNRLLQEFPSIPDNHFQSFQLMYLKKYMKSNDDNDTPSNPLPNGTTPSLSSPALAPTNINPLHVLPLTPNSSTPANPSQSSVPTSTYVEQVTPSTEYATTEHLSPVNGHVDIALLLTINNIVAGISRRLDSIGYDNISNNSYFTTATKLLTIKDIHHIEMDRAKMFMVCQEYSGHRV